MSPTPVIPIVQRPDLGAASPVVPPRPPVRLPPPDLTRPRRRGAGLALVAVILLGFALAAGLAALRPAPGGRRGGSVSIPGYGVAPTSAAVGCTVAPRSIQFFRALLGTPIPVTTPPPFDPSAGAPAAPAVVDGVTTTMQELFACVNARDALRIYALLTDSYLRQEVRERGPKTPQEVAGLARYTPTPATASEQIHLLGVASVRQWPDGRVGAIATVGLPKEMAPNVVTYDVIFARVNGRWLIDGLYQVTPPGTPGAASSMREGPATVSALPSAP